MIAVTVSGNITEEDSLEQFYGVPVENEVEKRPNIGGETTHARKEVTPGEEYYFLPPLPQFDKYKRPVVLESICIYF